MTDMAVPSGKETQTCEASKEPRVAVVLGSKNDLLAVQPALDTLSDLGVEFELRILSAHRTPQRTAEFAAGAHHRGLRVVVAAAGGAAHLAGAIAAHTTLPVIGVPLAATPLAGIDALLATVQMPAGVPVATVAVGGAANAALLAAQILALSDVALAERLAEARAELGRKVVAQDEEVRASR